MHQWKEVTSIGFNIVKWEPKISCIMLLTQNFRLSTKTRFFALKKPSTGISHILCHEKCVVSIKFNWIIVASFWCNFERRGYPFSYRVTARQHKKNCGKWHNFNNKFLLTLVQTFLFLRAKTSIQSKTGIYYRTNLWGMNLTRPRLTLVDFEVGLWKQMILCSFGMIFVSICLLVHLH